MVLLRSILGSIATFFSIPHTPNFFPPPPTRAPRPTPQPSTTTAPDGASFNLIQDVDLVGNDIAQTYQTSAQRCIADCNTTPRCKAFNWDGNTCWLKSAAGEQVPAPGTVSGIQGNGASTPAPQTTQKTSSPSPSTSTPSSAPTSSPTSSPSSAPTPTPNTSCSRIRKSWDSLTADEQSTFVAAVALAMDKGMLQKFVLIHSEQMSNTEGHGTCVFLFWHRKFLLSFENMLRSLGDRYKCLTLPYWDYVQHYAAMQNSPSNQRCSSIEACSPVAKGLGGSTQGTTSSKAFFGVRFTNNRCVSASPANHMCDGSSTCDRCVPRGNWASTAMVADMSIDSVRSRLFSSGTDIAAVSKSIETSPHNVLHDTLGGAMRNVGVSPMDPMFYVHHTTMDLLHTIFYHCRVEPLNLNDSDRQTNSKSFQGCRTNNGYNVGATSSLTMRVGGTQNPVDVTRDPLIGQFFQGLPNQYYQLTDARALGYSYEIKGLLGDLYTKCDGTSTESTSVKSATESVAVNSTTESLSIDHVVKPIVLEANKVSISMRDDVLAQATAAGLTNDQAMEELNKINVVMHESCMPGSVVDFSAEFKESMHIDGLAPDFALLQDIKSGKNPIAVPQWKSLLVKYYNCSVGSVYA
ncbi:hypothetical protein LEN26_008155 [Aphanomyces euteiches]|nr:hypothetical protein LEN26_008155 [Aphanomyces euteiches]